MSETGASDVDRLLARAEGGPRTSRAATERALVELRTPDAFRLTERQRALALNIVNRLLVALEDDIRAMTAETLAGHGPAFQAASLAVSRGGSAWNRGERLLPKRYRRLLREALARGNEHVVTSAIREGEGSALAPDASAIASVLANHADAALSQRAMDYVVAESRRYDRFGEPVLPVEELSSRTAASAAWLAAAALRRSQLRETPHDERALDGAIQDAVRRRLALRDARTGVEWRASRLIARLAKVGEVDDEFLIAVIQGGQAPLFCAALAHRAGIRSKAVHAMLVAPDDAALILLLRAVDISEAAARTILGALAPSRDRPEPSRPLDAYEQIAPAAAQRQLHRWSLDPGYARAIAAVEEEWGA